MQIQRTTATHIMSRAIQGQGEILLGVMDSTESMAYCYTQQDLEKLITQKPDAIWVHNQNAEACEIFEQLEFKDGQRSIEVFQDTQGVFGLRAYQMKGKIQTPVTLELSE